MRTMPTTARILASIVCVAAIIATLIPWYADHLMNVALKRAEMGWQAEALHAAQQSVNYNPLSINSRFVLAGAQQRLGRTREAKETVANATAMQPDNYIAWEQLAIYERDKWGEPDLAREHFAKAVSLNPHDQRLRVQAGLPEENSD